MKTGNTAKRYRRNAESGVCTRPPDHDRPTNQHTPRRRRTPSDLHSLRGQAQTQAQAHALPSPGIRCTHARAAGATARTAVETADDGNLILCSVRYVKQHMRCASFRAS